MTVRDFVSLLDSFDDNMLVTIESPESEDQWLLARMSIEPDRPIELVIELTAVKQVPL